MYKEIRYCLYLWSLSVFLKCIYWNYFYDPFTPFKNFTYWLSLLVLEITYDAPTKGGNLHNVVTHVIWANQMNESFVYRWQRSHASFEVTCFLEHWASFQVFCRYVTRHSWRKWGSSQSLVKIIHYYKQCWLVGLIPVTTQSGITTA